MSNRSTGHPPMTCALGLKAFLLNTACTESTKRNRCPYSCATCTELSIYFVGNWTFRTGVGTNSPRRRTIFETRDSAENCSFPTPPHLQAHMQWDEVVSELSEKSRRPRCQSRVTSLLRALGLHFTLPQTLLIFEQVPMFQHPLFLYHSSYSKANLAGLLAEAFSPGSFATRQCAAATCYCLFKTKYYLFGKQSTVVRGAGYSKEDGLHVTHT